MCRNLIKPKTGLDYRLLGKWIPLCCALGAVWITIIYYRRLYLWKILITYEELCIKFSSKLINISFKIMNVTSSSSLSEIDDTDSDPDFLLEGSNSSLAVSSMDDSLNETCEAVFDKKLKKKKKECTTNLAYETDDDTPAQTN
ncbi:Uncharacterized protein FWK35_00022734 [Aphis craccivora]|uniref:Uncharacterized protein n=1 Tax=Aphis craccivora TaxID=307492 RepID=A0A6G0XLJ2_APHCR|nr:Uncharacterized protein FWK35_00022734 [Aphis craccivora]